MAEPKVATLGVIDIGSNSVRLVMYDSLKRYPIPLANEKILCGLARDMESTGMLYAPGREEALDALSRFAILIKAMQVDDLAVCATSAVRDAKDGGAFIKEIKEKMGFDVRILSGEEEATHAAHGIAAAFFSAKGVVGDLGGGSLELARIDHVPAHWKTTPEAVISHTQSFPIGALRLKVLAEEDPKKAGEVVQKTLMQYPLLEHLQGKTFFAVGGGFRALAKIHLIKNNFPLHILHHLEMKADDIYQTARWVAAQKPQNLVKQGLVSSDRKDTIVYSAEVLEGIISMGKPKTVMFSATGVREGLLFSRLSQNAQSFDPLITTCKEVIRHISPNSSDDWVALGQELYDWMSPLFRTENDAIKRLRRAACILCHLSWYEHTEYRAEMAFRWVLDSSIPAIGHEDRVFVASAVFHRYRTETDAEVTNLTTALLSEQMAFRARVIGIAMQLGYKLSGGCAHLHPSGCSLSLLGQYHSVHTYADHDHRHSSTSPHLRYVALKANFL
jgi:exopolyphosphatase/guanosine-5'-triphosphate,3'-diphosphate pyrophosphatase